jgi:hypothetical protein
MTITQAQSDAREFLLRDCPIVGLYGETGAGKTTFVASLMGDPRYRKTLFIDGDRGGATVAHMTSQAELCDYRSPKQATNSLAVTQWICREIANAHKVPGVQSIVIEGIARVYEDAVGEQFASADESSLVGHKLRRLYIVPSGHVKAIFATIGNLQAQLAKAGRACPIFVTVNTKDMTDDESGDTWQVPAISNSATKIVMGRADAFVQLQRVGKNVSVLTDRDHRTSLRKVRGHAAAIAIAKMRNPDAVTMLQVWADAIAADAIAVVNHLQTQAQPQESNTP